MSDGTYRGRWVDEVFRSPVVSAEVKVFLLFLDHRGHVSDTGRISVPRDELADALGCHPRKVSAKFAAAISAGIMRQVSRGQKHQTAVYQVVAPGVPEPSQGASTRHPEVSQEAGTWHPEPDSQGDKNRHPENAQGADTRHPETVSGCQHPAPHIHTHLPDDEHATGGSVVALFDEKTTAGKTHTARKRASAHESDDAAFAEFWKTYPKRVAKGAARKAWDKAIKNGADPQDIILGARRYNSDPRRSSSDIRYTAHPATWLNAERWADEDEPPPSGLAVAPLDRRQQATEDMFSRALARAAAREETSR